MQNIGVAGLEGQFVTLNAHIREKKVKSQWFKFMEFKK